MVKTRQTFNNDFLKFLDTMQESIYTWKLMSDNNRLSIINLYLTNSNYYKHYLEFLEILDMLEERREAV